MQLTQSFRVEFRHVKNCRADTKLGQDIRDYKEDPSNLTNADVCWGKNPRNCERRGPGEDLGGPFGAHCPGKTAGKGSVQLPCIVGLSGQVRG